MPISGVDVAARERAHEALDGIVELRCDGAVRLGAVDDDPPGPLQRAVDRRDAGPERRGRLARAEPEDVAEDQRRPLLGREMLERDRQRERGILLLLVAGRGRVQLGVERPSLPHVLVRPSSGSNASGRFSSAVRQMLVAIRYSHERMEDRPSNVGSARHARSITSCIASSASWADPSMRRQCAWSGPRSGATSSRNAASSPRRAASISRRSRHRSSSARAALQTASNGSADGRRTCGASRSAAPRRRLRPLAATPSSGRVRPGATRMAGAGAPAGRRARRRRSSPGRRAPASARISTWRRIGGQPRSRARSASAAAAAAPAPRPATTSLPGSAPSSSPWSAAHTSAASARSSAPGRRGAQGMQSTTAPTREQSSCPSASSAALHAVRRRGVGEEDHQRRRRRRAASAASGPGRGCFRRARAASGLRRGARQSGRWLRSSPCSRSCRAEVRRASPITHGRLAHSAWPAAAARG